MAEIWTIKGGQKDALLRRPTLKKIATKIFPFRRILDRACLISNFFVKSGFYYGMEMEINFVVILKV